jgi:hypothetical protein
MGDVIGIVVVFGGAGLIAFSFSPSGRAIAERIRGRGRAPDQDVEGLKRRLTELEERLDFTERLLAQERSAARFAGPR